MLRSELKHLCILARRLQVSKQHLLWGVKLMDRTYLGVTWSRMVRRQPSEQRALTTTGHDAVGCQAPECLACVEEVTL